MNKQEPSWELYRTYLEVLRGGSLSAAARVLGLTQPTVGRQIDALEQALGVSLFVRTQRGFSATDAGQRLRPYAETLEATSAALLRVAADRSEQVDGRVRITASEMIAVEVLPMILADLQHQHPQLTIELVPSNRVEDLLQREADIAIRMVQPSQNALVAKRLGEIHLGLFAHRDYLERRGTPVSLEQLAGHALIGFDRETAFTRSVVAQLPWLQRERFRLCTDSDLAALAALRAGFGIGVSQLGIARRDTNLVRLFPQQLRFRLEAWLVMHEDLRDSPSCQAAFQALAKGMQGYVLSSTDPA